MVEEMLAPGAVVSEVARRHGVAESLLFAGRRLTRTADRAGRGGPILLPVETDTMAPPPLSAAARPARPPANGRRPKPGVIEIQLESRNRVRVDAYNRLDLADRRPDPIREAACWAHPRRKFAVFACVEENARRKAAGKT